MKYEEVILFGTGALLPKALDFLNKREIKVKFLTDNNKEIQNKYKENILVIAPEDIVQYNLPVLIISMYSKDIALQLINLGVKEFQDFSFIFDYERWNGHFDKEKIKNSQVEINNFIELLEDSESKNIIESLLKYRQSLNPSAINNAHFDDYFHPLVAPIKGDVIIDGGAWHGDSSLNFSKKLNNNCTIYAFEPEEENFIQLKKNISLNNCENIIPVLYGLSDKKDVVYFETSNDFDMQHKVTDKPTNKKIEVISIDDFKKSNNIKKIDFIKMDIEGSEYKALLGAKEVLLTDKPKLAICTYHLYDDLWAIPLLIKKLNKDYKLYVGHHSQNLLDTVIYAI